MSTPETFQPVEQRSSVKIAQTAKGDPVVEVKVYDGTDPDDLDAARALAVAAYRQTVREVKHTLPHDEGRP